MDDLFTITTLCDADWEAMTPCGDGVRHCAGCGERVWDIESLEPIYAAEVAADQSNCLRVTRTSEGRILTKGGVALLAASLTLMPAVALAAPRTPLVDHHPTERQLDRARAQASKNVVVLEGSLVKKPHGEGPLKKLIRPKVFLGRRGD